MNLPAGRCMAAESEVSDLGVGAQLTVPELIVPDPGKPGIDLKIGEAAAYAGFLIVLHQLTPPPVIKSSGERLVAQ